METTGYVEDEVKAISSIFTRQVEGRNREREGGEGRKGGGRERERKGERVKVR